MDIRMGSIPFDDEKAEVAFNDHDGKTRYSMDPDYVCMGSGKDNPCIFERRRK